jgi:cobalt/nickel transport system permease protein
MHLAEGTLPMVHAATGWALAAPALGWSLAGARRAAAPSDPGAPALLPAATSLLFAATLLPVPVPVVGATSHICLTPVLALLLGVRSIVWPSFFVLLLQALFFAHGGLTTLGVNALTLGVLGPLVAVTVAPALRWSGLSTAVAIGLACAVADLGVYVADAGILAAALADTAAPGATFTTVLLGFAPVQLPLAVLEGLVSVALVRMLRRRRPALLPAWLQEDDRRPAGGGGALAAFFLIFLGGCEYQGIDGTVFGSIAEAAGQPARDSLLDFSQGELGLAVSIVVPFVFGFVAGRTWERLGGARHASPT